MSISRRQFVRGAAAGLPVLVLTEAEAGAGAGAGVQTPLDPALTRALAEVVLPSELGAEGRRSAVRAFQAWLAAYAPVAERNHGYGTGEIEYLPADPAPGWNAQLTALNLESVQRHARGFADIGVLQRRMLVERHIRGDRLPSALEAHHVALGMLAWWCDTPAAHDLAYRARITPTACRSLATAPAEPPSLEGDA